MVSRSELQGISESSIVRPGKLHGNVAAGGTMGKKKNGRSHADELRGVSRVAIDATKGVTDVVEGMHVTIASGPAILGKPLAVPARLLTGLVYGGIRGVTRVVGASLDAVLTQLAPFLGSSAPGPERGAVIAALNGIIGDYLSETSNPLATEMALCHRGEVLELTQSALAAAFPDARSHVVVLAHGCAMNDTQWRRRGHDYGAVLASAIGCTPVYLRYNSGLHVSTNGHTFAALLEELHAAWPVPIQSLTLLCHSMGGLVARSACHAAESERQAWRAKLTALVTLGTPHHGAPLERGGAWVDVLLGVSRYSAPLARLGKLRSAGVTDLRYGNVLDEHWSGRDRFARSGDPRRALSLPKGVACYAVAASLSAAATGAKGAPKSLRGDGLVPVDSALGRHKRADLVLAFPEDHQFVGYSMGHLDLLYREEIADKLIEWLR